MPSLSASSSSRAWRSSASARFERFAGGLQAIAAGRDLFLGGAFGASAWFSSAVERFDLRLDGLELLLRNRA